VGAARKSSDDLGVELRWPEDELAARVRPRPGPSPPPIDAVSRPHGAFLARRSPRDFPLGSTDVANAVDVLGDRIDALADTVRGLHAELAVRFGDHNRQLASFRLRLSHVETMGDALSAIKERRDELTRAIVEHSDQQEQLQQQISRLTKDIQSLRRRVSIQAKDRPAGLTDEQIEAVAQEILAALQRRGAEGGGTRPRKPVRSTRK